MILDRNVGLTALQSYVSNANLEVGSVTVRHLIFSELIVQIKSGVGLEDAREVFRLCFNNNGKSDIKYVSPLGSISKSDDGIDFLKISPRLAQLVYKQCCTMAINEANVLQACDDLIACGRMYQEMTIDAAKNMYDVNIPYGDDMRHCHLLSRDNEDVDISLKCDWKDAAENNISLIEELQSSVEENKKLNARTWKKYKHVKYIINENDSITENKKVGDQIMPVRFVSDFMQKLRCRLIEEGKFFASDMMDIKQNFPDDLKEKITSMLLSRDMKKALAVVRFYHDIFRTVTTYKTNEIAAAKKIYKPRSLSLSEKIKEIKRKAAENYRFISNQIRLELDKLGVPIEKRIYVLIGEVLEAKDNSSFAHIILPEEFFLFIMDLYKDNDNVPKYTEDELISCTYKEGDEVEFNAGISFSDSSSKYARAKIGLEGKFLIRRNRYNKLVASRLITDLIKIPAPDPSKLLFITKAGGGNDTHTSTNLENVAKNMIDAEIQLIPYGNNFHDSIVADNKEIGHFRCSANLDKVVSSDTMKRMSSAINNIFKNKKGKMESIIATDMEGTVGKVAVVCLKNVETAPIPSDTIMLKDSASTSPIIKPKENSNLEDELEALLSLINSTSKKIA